MQSQRDIREKLILWTRVWKKYTIRVDRHSVSRGTILVHFAVGNFTRNNDLLRYFSLKMQYAKRYSYLQKNKFIDTSSDTVGYK